MPPLPISPVDAVTPALDASKRLMFQPFQWARWWRMGLVALVTGEVATMGGCNFGSGFPDIPRGGEGSEGFISSSYWQSAPAIPGLEPATVALLVTLLIFFGGLLFLAHIYIGSVLRFVLFDSVARARFEIVDGWKRWHPQGLRLFGFMLLFTLAVAAGFLLIVGGAILAGIGVGASQQASRAAMVGAILLLLPFLIALAVLVWLFYLFVKDFAVPVLAVDQRTLTDALSRVWQIARRDKGSFAGYVGMKIVLSIAAAILLGIVAFILVLIIAIPIVVGGIFAGLSFPQLLRDPLVLAGLITGLIFAILLFTYVVAVIGSPITVFFQAYALEFLGSRYEPLWVVLHGQVPPPPMPGQATVSPPVEPAPAM